jgi:fumarylpyruvate hydrolase
MKIILIGDNTPTHKPYLFMKPDSALLKDNKPFFIPDFTESITASMHLVIRISRLGKNIAERFAPRYYDAVTIGIDLTAADTLQKCRIDGMPWEVSNGFDGSAVIGSFIPTDRFASLQTLHLKLNCDGETIQEGHTSEMLLSADRIVSWVSKYYTMKTGDLIYLGAFGTTKVNIDMRLQGYLEREELFDFHIR